VRLAAGTPDDPTEWIEHHDKHMTLRIDSSELQLVLTCCLT